MGSYCEANGFYRKKIGMCGSVSCPETDVSDEIYCEKCHIEAKKTRIGEDSSVNRSERGSLRKVWCIVEVECPQYGINGKVTEDFAETDVTYYSNEERRVFRI